MIIQQTKKARCKRYMVQSNFKHKLSIVNCQLIIIATLLAFHFALFTSAIAQSPQGINYQAVARDAAGNPLASQSVTVAFKIHCGAAGGNVSCAETQTLTTNQFGLFNYVIGSSNHNNFDTIAWGKHAYFLEVIVNTYNMGATQFISVPYAFHSATADSITSPPLGSLIWKKNNDSVFVVSIASNVGIGTTSPFAKLTVQATSGKYDALNVTHKGNGRAGVFWSDNPANDSTNLISYTNGKGNAVFGINMGPKGHAGVFAVNNSSSGGCGLIGSTNGIGKAVFGYQTGLGYGGAFWINNPANDSAALVGLTNGDGPAVYGIAGGLGYAGIFEITNPGNPSTALHSVTNGTGNAISGYNIGTGKAGIFQINNLSSAASALYATTNGTGLAGEFIGKIKINDGTAGANKVLTSVDAAGTAQWQSLPVNLTGTGTATQVAFWNGATSLSSNSNLYWDNTNFRLGIGTSSPSYPLHVTTGGTTDAMMVVNTYTASRAATFSISNAGNGSAAVYATTSGSGSAGYFNATSTANALMGYTTGTRRAGDFMIANTANTYPAVDVTTNGNNSKALNVSHTGASNNATDYGVYSNATGGGTTTTNVGGYFSASGATYNYAGIFDQGNVGIGTTTPSYPLHVTSPSAANIFAANIENTNANGWGLSIRNTNTDNTKFALAAYNNTNIRYDFVVTNAGNVGIGITAPSAKLHVALTTTALATAQKIDYTTTSTDGAGVNAGLHVNANANGTVAQHGVYSQTISGSTGTAVAIGAYATGNSGSKRGLDVGAMGSGTNIGLFVDASGGATNYAAIFNSGDVGIGTTTPGAKLEVAGQVKITGGSPAIGAVLTSSDAAGLAVWQLPPGFTNMATFSVTTTWTVPAGVTKIMVEVCGGGGGGAGTGNSNAAGGGGGGGYAKGIFTVTPSSTLNVNVGNGGAAGTAGGGGGNGGTGGTSSVNTTPVISASGGTGGNNIGTGGNGGSGSAPFSITGGQGFYGGSNMFSYGGNGANGGSGGIGGIPTILGGDGIVPGGGGGGSYVGQNLKGGIGAPGRVVIWW